MKLSPRSCERAREWASLRLDGELSDFERALLGAHLERCADCARFVSEVDATTRTLRAAHAERLAQPVALPSRPSRRLLTPRVMSAGAAAAALAAAVGLGTLFGSLGGANRAVATRMPRSAVSSQPIGEIGLIQLPKYAMLMHRAGAAGPQRGLRIADL